MKLNLNEVDNLIFDLGNVLLDVNIQTTIAEFQSLGITGFDPATISPHNQGLFLDQELGHVTREQFIAGIQSFVQGDRMPSQDEILAAWNRMLQPYDFRRFELIDRLKSDYRIFLLSNTNEEHHIYFEEVFARENPEGRSFESYFEQIFYSDLMHLRKPDPEIYRQTIIQAGIDPSRTLFIDDNAANIASAREVGLQTYLLLKPETVLDLF